MSQTPSFQNSDLTKMQNLLSQVYALSEKQECFDDQKLRNLQYQVHQTIREVFGPDSSEFNAHKDYNWLCNYRMKNEDAVKQKKNLEGIPKMISMLESLIITLENKQIS
jgi:hypothetical protein